MCCMNVLDGDAPGTSEAVLPCPFCGNDRATGIEIDQGKWAVCCSWCGTIGPHSRCVRMAVARWNSPLDSGRQNKPGVRS